MEGHKRKKEMGKKSVLSKLIQKKIVPRNNVKNKLNILLKKKMKKYLNFIKYTVTAGHKQSKNQELEKFLLLYDNDIITLRKKRWNMYKINQYHK